MSGASARILGEWSKAGEWAESSLAFGLFVSHTLAEGLRACPEVPGIELKDD